MSSGNLLGLHRIALVGREEYLNRIFMQGKDAYSKKRPLVMTLEGKGGIGKTAILQEVLRQLRETPNVIMPDDFIDLYHLENQTAHGLAESIADSLNNYAQEKFTKFKGILREMYEAISRNEPQKKDELWLKAEKEFFNVLKGLSKTAQLWIILDTIEAVYLGPRDERQDEIDDSQGDGVYQWINKLMNDLGTGPVVLLLAGRPPDEGYRRIPAPVHWIQPSVMQLEPLNEEHCVKYLKRLADFVTEHGDEAGAKNITDYLRQYSSTLVYTQSEGKPLYLAMVGDILMLGGSLPRGYYEREESTAGIESLSRHFMELRSPIGITLRTMAILRKGVDAHLLALLLTGKDEKPDKESAASYLAQVADLILVKRRHRRDASQERFFLHDEIYNLYANHFPLTEANRQHYYQRIIRYYDFEQKELERLERESPMLRGQYRMRLYISHVEAMHYTLRLQPWRGFSFYFVLSESAINQRSKDWDLLLDSELARTKHNLQNLPSPTLPPELESFFEWDKTLRKVNRLSAYYDDDQAAQKIKEIQINKNTPSFYIAYYHLLCATLVARRQDKSHHAEQGLTMLNNAEDCLVKNDKHPDLKDAVEVLKGFIENYRGLFYRRRGQYHKAVKSYQNATARLRRHRFTGLSGTLVNLAYAMSLIGYDDRAREIAREAYDLAIRHGSVHDQIRALNIRCQISSFAGKAREAVEFGQKALDLLKTSPHPRLQGLVYLSLGRAYRYLWNQSVMDERMDDGYHYLLTGLDYIEEKEKIDHILKREEKPTKFNKNKESRPPPKNALNLLCNPPDPENYSLACNESGALWREICWWHRKKIENTKKSDSKIDHITLEEKDIIKKSGDLADERFRLAAGINGVKPDAWVETIKQSVEKSEISPYVFILPLVNLAWHYHYLGEKKERIDRILETIENVIPEDHCWRENKMPEVASEDADVMLWAVMGKVEMLRGYELLRDWRNKQKDNPKIIDQAVYHMALALEYGYLHGQASFNARRALAALENRIRQSADWERKLLPEFYKAIQKVRLRGDEKQPRLFKWLEERFGPAELWE